MGGIHEIYLLLLVGELGGGGKVIVGEVGGLK